jgi:hypothetical protein
MIKYLIFPIIYIIAFILILFFKGVHGNWGTILNSVGLFAYMFYKEVQKFSEMLEKDIEERYNRRND